MPYKIVPEDKVPKAPASSAPSRARYFHRLLEELPVGKVVTIVEPEDDQTIRGIKISIGRVAHSLDFKVLCWDNADKDKAATEVYVKKIS